MWRVTKDGGVVVWVVADETKDYSETGTSFKQALYFKEIGFNIHDTMIYLKTGLGMPHQDRRYRNAFEYMFVFSKGRPNVYNLFTFPETGIIKPTTRRAKDGTISKGLYKVGGGVLGNVWQYPGQHSDHPAPFPSQLVKDHILTWSNPGQIVFDPFMGSGTTAIVAIETKRQFLGFEISEQYCNMANKRIQDHIYQESLF